MSAIASQITSLMIVYSTIYSGADQRKHQSSASLAFVRGIRRGPVNSPHKGPVTRKKCPFDDVIMRHISEFSVHASRYSPKKRRDNYSDYIMSAMASQITGVSIVFPTVCSGKDQRKHQSSASLAFVRGIHRWPVNSPHNWPVTWKMLPFDDVVMLMTSSGA